MRPFGDRKMPRERISFSRSFLEECARLFEQEYVLPDLVLDLVFRQRFASNTDKREIYIKVAVLNSLYGTNIYDLEAMAEHIDASAIDGKLHRGDVTVIEDIRRGHGIRRRSMAEDLDFYVFATKYASFHQPARFPIIDSFVKRLLVNLDRCLIPNINTEVTYDRLLEYSFFKNVVDDLIEHLGIDLSTFNYKKVDQGLWLYGKHKYGKNDGRLSELLTGEIERLLEVQLR